MKIKDINIRALSYNLAAGFGLAFLFSIFIYAEHFGLTYTLVNTLTATAAFFFFLIAPARIVLIAGFFIGLFWFYWIGYSFKYYHVGWLTPFVTLFFALLYTLFFGVAAVTKRPLYRAGILLALSFVEPMDWNWMQMELPFIDTFFGVEKWQFALILLSLALFHTLQGKIRFAALLILLGALDFAVPHYTEPPLRIKLHASTLLQENKWLPQNRQQIILDNLKVIAAARREGYDLVVLPESAFPLFLNRNPQLVKLLQEYSHDIDIIAGALYIEEGLHYNVSYHFAGGKIEIAKKMVLVPFGEYIPLPAFIRSWVNKSFFDGASDFVTAKVPSDFRVKGVTFRNAICYEATCEEVYEGDPPYLVAISNNGWFHPSIEPTLQRLLMRFYAKKHHSLIYHSANMGGTGIIKGER